MGVKLYYQDPAFFSLSCDICEQFMHTNGVLTLRAGEPVARPKGVVTPCWKCPKIPRTAPRKTREFAEEISDKNYQAFKFHLRCKAVGHFPDDPIVARNAEVIESVIESIRDAKQEELVQTLLAIASMGGGGRGR